MSIDKEVGKVFREGTACAEAQRHSLLYRRNKCNSLLIIGGEGTVPAGGSRDLNLVFCHVGAFSSRRHLSAG